MGQFNANADDNVPDNIHPDHVLWPTNRLTEWLQFSGTSMAKTEIQRSVMREAAKRLLHMADNPRNAEQDALRVFIKLAEILDEYCMGGTHQKHTLEDIRHEANDAANQARALLDMFPKSTACTGMNDPVAEVKRLRMEVLMLHRQVSREASFRFKIGKLVREHSEYLQEQKKADEAALSAKEAE